MKKYVIIVAGGSGTRMNAKVPKQFLQVAGKPILWHTIKKFYDADRSTDIILVLPRIYIAKWERLAKKFSGAIRYTVVGGGATRFDSVKNGLALVTEDSLVAIHDGVRPLASIKLIKKCFEEARKKGSAVP